MTACQILLLIIPIVLTVACKPSREQSPFLSPTSSAVVGKASAPISPTPSSRTLESPTGCQVCHAYENEVHPGLKCTSCHEGDPLAASQERAHTGLINHPADSAHLIEKCGPCHPSETSKIKESRHFTLSGEVNPVRRHFGATRDLSTATDIPLKERPDSPLALVDDLLRRRCMLCHVYYQGDDYGSTRRGHGCGACHLEYRDGKLLSHNFIATPGDRQCLACHYGNRVGADYYGYFEHDLRDEYRNPFQANGSRPSRPHGIEEHRLQPDVHQQAGMICLDCHTGLHQDNADTISCTGCHFWRSGQPRPAAGLEESEGRLSLRGKAGGRIINVPPARNPAHARYNAKVDCAVCHAQWTFNDTGTHLLRSDVEDYQAWDDLIVQGSSEVENQLLNSLYGKQEVPPTMTDKFTGQSRSGLWLKTLTTRRWESPPVGKDTNGRLRVLRPSLDLHLSWLDEQGQIRIDAATGTGDTMRPYTPHTIGKAGSFYQQRLHETPRPIKFHSDAK